MQITNLAPKAKLAVCLQKQLLCLYMCWIAATGLAFIFVILPGYQTLMKFQQTECTTLKVHKSGSNPCEYCLQVFVVTKEKSLVTRLLQQDELDNARCTFKSLCEVDEEKATSLFQSLTNIYGVNGSRYSCFTHRSHHSTLTVLYIKNYPQSTIIQVALSLSLTCVVLLAYTTHVCRPKRRKHQRMGKNMTHKKLSKNVITFHWTPRSNTSRKIIHV